MELARLARASRHSTAVFGNRCHKRTTIFSPIQRATCRAPGHKTRLRGQWPVRPHIQIQEGFPTASTRRERRPDQTGIAAATTTLQRNVLRCLQASGAPYGRHRRNVRGLQSGNGRRQQRQRQRVRETPEANVRYPVAGPGLPWPHTASSPSSPSSARHPRAIRRASGSPARIPATAKAAASARNSPTTRSPRHAQRAQDSNLLPP